MQRTRSRPDPHTLEQIVDQSLAARCACTRVEMGALVIDQVAGAVRHCSSATLRLAHAVLAREARVDEYEKQLDRDSLTFIALQQPVASDLRLARAIVRIGRELERAGDEAKKIARFALTLEKAADGRSRCWRCRASCGTWRRCRLDAAQRRAGRRRDGPRSMARTVLAARRRTGCRVRRRAAAGDVVRAARTTASCAPTIDTIFALKGLERIGDHARNIAEQVLYMMEGSGRKWKRDRG